MESNRHSFTSASTTTTILLAFLLSLGFFIAAVGSWLKKLHSVKGASPRSPTKRPPDREAKISLYTSNADPPTPKPNPSSLTPQISTPQQVPVVPARDASSYTVGWICAILPEYVAAQQFLDENHGVPTEVQIHDHNEYTLGKIGEHYVVIATMPEGQYGLSCATGVATSMMHSFPNIRIGLMVGIAGGAPRLPKQDIRLGDIVVSAPCNGIGGVFQYDFGKTIQDQIFRPTGVLNQPPQVLRAAVAGMRAKYQINGHCIDASINNVLAKNPRLKKWYKKPDLDSDRLYKSDVIHPNDEADCKIDCGDTKTKLILRQGRSEDEDNPAIHYGLIASANQLMKDASIRDRLSKEKGVLCFEMEAAGLMNHFPCLIIRGICDYADSHKNKEWQGYAAMAAAAYAKDLLYCIRPNKVEAEKKISDILSSVQEIKSTIKGIALDQTRQDMFKWLSPLRPSARHSANQKRRVTGTGSWLLENPNFSEWTARGEKIRTLCCYGNPGAGKTFITSIMIDELKERMGPKSDTGLSYLYCDYRDQMEQTAENIIGAILEQLLRPLPKIPETALKLYKDRVQEGKPLTLSDGVEIFRITCGQLSRVYIFLDALDELQPSELCQLLQILQNLRDCPSTRICITARPHMQVIVQKYLEEDHVIHIEARESDIHRLVEYQIGGQNDIEPKAMSEELKTRIHEKIVKSARGIFLLPMLQIATVLQATTVRDRLTALKRLPSNLGDAFAGTMSRIKEQPVTLSERAGKIIAWIHLAERPLTVDELLEALTVRAGDTYFDPTGTPIRETLLNCCHGLAVIDQETSTVRLVHFSLQEYLLQQDQIQGITRAQWHSEIASTCLTFLGFESGTAGHPYHNLVSYASTEWGHHLRRCEDIQDAPTELAKKYLNYGWQKHPSSVRLLYEDMYRHLFPPDLPHHVLPIHITAFFGTPRVMNDLLLAGLNFNVKDTAGRTPLGWAAQKGHAPVVTLLLDRGADTSAADNDGWTPLHLAAAHDHFKVAQLLLDRGADASAADGHGRTPLHLATSNRHLKVIQLLLDRGAYISAADKDGWTPLHTVASHDHLQVIQLLIDRGADIAATDNCRRTPLHLAVSNSHLEVAQLLLDKGADVSAADNDGWTPLYLATSSGHLEILQLLLDRGADVSANGAYGRGTLLHIAASCGYFEVTQLLLDRGADASAADGHGRTPLHLAASGRRLKVAQLLLDRGADVSVADQYGRAPLHSAASCGHLEVAQLLLDRGANVSAADHRGWTPLHTVASHGHLEVIQPLLDKGADASAAEDHGWSPLYLAVSNGHLEVAQLLLDRGVDVLAADNYGWTLLHLVGSHGHLKFVQLLLDKGADISAADVFGKTPLHLAASHGHPQVVQLLIDRGADIAAADEYGRTPLTLAARGGHSEVVQLLLDRGADIVEADNPGPISYSYVSPSGHRGFVRSLADMDVDIFADDDDGWH